MLTRIKSKWWWLLWSTAGVIVITWAVSSRPLQAQDIAGPKFSYPIQRILEFESEERKLLREQATTHSDLADLYVGFGKYDQAVVRYRNALGYFKPTDDSYIENANRLARVYLELGRFAECRQLLDQNVNVLTVNSSYQTKRQLADTLALLAEFHRETGDFVLANDEYHRVLELRKETTGVSDRTYGVALHNLGIFEWEQGNIDQAEDLLREELKITESRDVAGEDLAHSRESLALVLTYAGKYPEAESQFKQAIEIYDQLQGVDRNRNRTVSNLGYLHIFTGQYDDAKKYLNEAAKGRKEQLGENHLDCADSLNDLARLFYVQGEFDLAMAEARKSLAITRENVELAATVQSERQQMAMAALFRERLDLLLSAASHRPEAAQEAFNEIVAWKGATLMRQRGLRKLTQDAAVAKEFENLQQLVMRIASLSRTVPIDPQNYSLWKQELNDLKSARDALEAKLSSHCVELHNAVDKISSQELAECLPEGTVFVDVFEYNHQQVAEDRGRFEAIPSLMANVLTRNGIVSSIHYGPSADIAIDVDVWRESFGGTQQGAAAGQRLRRKIWEPLLPRIGDAQTVLVTLDGVLGRLALGALPGREPGTYLIEDHRVALVPVPRLLPTIIARDSRRKLSNHLLLMGAVDYDGMGDENPTEVEELPPWERRNAPAVRDANHRFARLQNTPGEIAFIQRLYQKQPWSRQDGLVLLEEAGATEIRFRENAPQCYQIHLATHGFFADPDKVSATSTRSRSQAGAWSSYSDAVRGFSPGLLSGLAFAGANRPPQPDHDDGIMTADEIAFLPLDGVELVVLSACETGLGEVAGGEGLIGIQRSFQVSGARTTVASLWQVPDKATRVLMEKFYENYWVGKMPRLDALREAQLYVLNHPDVARGVRRVSQQAESADNSRLPPEYWAAFVLSGDWR
ncbi:CHAT domain-containing tetratricopeptide repeat protein [Stieleria varia]|uniref:CHAT domain protein n=1 Tax=Stieleria varia TaxID=2528005 RepID=A0A5C6AT05_9BACT|nr:CHAT domain-containing tetratricopeptide repeat protein [Stieleria varia]TWU02840.1 CHAT domain protein [Stieleria varia]